MSEDKPKKVRPNAKRKGRSLQRQYALDILFEADAKGLYGDDISDLLAQRQKVSTHQEPIGEYGLKIVRAYVDSEDDVNTMLEAASPAWSVDRMGMVDRNLLRVGATELMYLDVDLPVVVKEIAALARDLSTDKAVGFTMGVLNRIGEIRALETSGAADFVPVSVDDVEGAEPDVQTELVLEPESDETATDGTADSAVDKHADSEN